MPRAERDARHLLELTSWHFMTMAVAAGLVAHGPLQSKVYETMLRCSSTGLAEMEATTGLRKERRCRPKLGLSHATYVYKLEIPSCQSRPTEGALMRDAVDDLRVLILGLGKAFRKTQQKRSSLQDPNPLTTFLPRFVGGLWCGEVVSRHPVSSFSVRTGYGDSDTVSTKQRSVEACERCP